MDRSKLIEKAGAWFDNEIKTKFIAGETYIPPSGKVLDKDDFMSLLNAAFDLSITEGKYSDEFEKELRTVFKNTIRQVSLTNSGSSANLLAVTTITDRVFGEKRAKAGDEIITVAAGFPTTLNPLIQNNLVPVFVDVDLDTFTPNPEVIETAVTPKTKGILLAHPLGNPFDAEAIRDICDEYGLWMIEDTCDALGGTLNGRMLGSFGDISTLSFYPAHQITSGEGGACLTQSPMVEKVLNSYRDWGRNCFIRGTLINSMEEQIPIESINCGDMVLTDDGTLHQVLSHFKRSYSGRLYTITPSNLPPIVCTHDHPFLVSKGKEKIWINAEDLQEGDILLERQIPITNKFSTYEETYNTLYGKKKFSVNVTPDLFRLIGYYLAEGSVSSGLKGRSGYKENKYKFYRVDFSFNENEKEYIDDVKNLMKLNFGVNCSQRKDRNSHGVSLFFKSRKAYEFFRHFRSPSYNKTIDHKFREVSDMCLKELIKGYWRGDGSSSNAGYSFVSSSPHLFNQIRRILARFGVIVSYSMRNEDTYHSSIVNGKKVEMKHPHYWGNIYGESSKLFEKIVEEHEYTLSPKPNKSWVDNEYIYHPISKISYENVENVEVFNLEIEGNHTYHANNLIVHNCWCEPGKDNTCGRRFDWKFEGLPDNYDHKYVYSRIGYNLKITDLQASLLVSQLRKLYRFKEQREKNWKALYAGLSKYKRYFRFQKSLSSAKPSWFGFALTVRETSPFNRHQLITFLESHQIGTRLLFGGNLLRQPAYKDIPHKKFEELINTDVIMRDTFWIGVYPGIQDEQIDYMLSVFDKFIKEL